MLSTSGGNRGPWPASGYLLMMMMMMMKSAAAIWPHSLSRPNKSTLELVFYVQFFVAITCQLTFNKTNC